MEEIWKEIPGYEGYYEVSNQGRVRSLDRETRNGNGSCIKKGRVLKFNADHQGYYKVVLYKNSNKRYFRVHQLVVMAFLNHKPDGHKNVVDHINNIKTDNRLENLQLISTRENNSKDRKGSSKYTGVHWSKKLNKWKAYITINGKRKHLGCFDTEKEAGQYYQDALKSIENGTEIKVKKTKFTSKYKGVNWDKQRNKWISCIQVNGKRKHLGRFNCELSASAAYQAELSKISVKN